MARRRIRSSIINLVGEINEECARKFLDELRDAELSGTRALEVRIVSGGGSSAGALSLYEALRLTQLKITTVALGWTESMAAIVFLTGKRRYIARRARLLFHAITGPHDTSGRRITQFVQEILRQHTSLSSRQIRRATHEEIIIWPEEAVKFGLAHKVI